MKRRISLGAVFAAGVSLALAVGIAPAAGKAGRRSSGPPRTLTVRCFLTLTTMPPNGSTAVVPPVSQGTQYGKVSCPQQGFYGGAMRDTFQVPDSGDTLGDYVQYLNSGTIRGSFDLTPQEGNFGGGSYQSQNWTGTVSVTSGTGAYQGITSSRNGTLTCTSPDSVHMSCEEFITVSLP